MPVKQEYWIEPQTNTQFGDLNFTSGRVQTPCTRRKGSYSVRLQDAKASIFFQEVQTAEKLKKKKKKDRNDNTFKQLTSTGAALLPPKKSSAEIAGVSEAVSG